MNHDKLRNFFNKASKAINITSGAAICLSMLALMFGHEYFDNEKAEAVRDYVTIPSAVLFLATWRLNATHKSVQNTIKPNNHNGEDRFEIIEAKDIWGKSSNDDGPWGGDIWNGNGPRIG